MMYDFIDNNDFIQSRSHKNKLLYTEFDRLLAERDQFNRRFLAKAYNISEGNISLMARGLKLSRKTLYRYLEEVFGRDYKIIFDKYASRG